MDRLLEGYRRFRAHGWPERRQRFEQLADGGQRPQALLIGCVDSRVDPAMILDAGPGELLVLRNVANLVPPYAPDEFHHATSAALEFAVRVLRVRNIVVMGHGMCGGIAALMNGAPPVATDFLVPWINIAAKARDRVLACDDGGDPQLACEHAAVALSIENLRGYPWVAERLIDGSLALYGAHFDIRHGILNLMGADGVFREA
ncbi:MAG: carbonic anhydrase [Acetobacteraceae bacterium]|nr:carbonic anhydrase [Acetobacteraceae bacterium]